jgi:hypothetical protein
MVCVDCHVSAAAVLHSTISAYHLIHAEIILVNQCFLHSVKGVKEQPPPVPSRPEETLVHQDIFSMPDEDERR